MRRWTLLVALAGLAVVVAAGVVVLWPRADRVTRANYERIQIGMTRADVEAILGPPGDYRTGHGEAGVNCLGEHGAVLDMQNMSWVPDDPDDLDSTLPKWSRNLANHSEDPRLWASWSTDSFEIVTRFDYSGGVADLWGYPRRTTQGPVANLLWRAKRQWRQWFPE
jgi:hypothetical protein